MKTKLIIFFVLFSLSFYIIASQTSPQRITLEPENLNPGTRIKISLNFGSKLGTIQSINIIGGVDRKTQNLVSSKMG